MKILFNSFARMVFWIVIFSCTQISKVHAQENSAVNEPPIPVYMIYPSLEDSLKSAYEGSIQGLSTAYVNAIKKYDTLQQQVQKSSAESTEHFIWLFSLVALLGIMNIVSLISISRIRKELTQMKHLEHRQMLLTSESAASVQGPPQTTELLNDQEQSKIQSPVRPRKHRSIKPRAKNQR